jgi:ATP-binding cassette subfamily C protein CydD
VRPVDPRLLRQASAARGYLAVTVGLGLAGTGLILAQASLLARALAGATTGTGLAALSGTLIALAAVLAARALTSYGGEVAALRAAAKVKSQLRRALTAHALRLGPAWIAGQQDGELATLSTRGLDALDAYFARYLPQLVLACLVPVAVLIRVGLADWISAMVIVVTLPLIPVFAVLVGLHTRTQTQRQWALLARLGGHFLDVVEGLPTLKVFGRARAQAEVISQVTDAHRRATMRTLRVAFLSAFVLELAATLATALVAVEVGLRLLAGHLDYQTALLVLLLTPEAYLPLRNAGAQFHASAEGTAAAEQALTILDTPLTPPSPVDPPAPITQPVPPAPITRPGPMTRPTQLAWPARPAQPTPASEVASPGRLPGQAPDLRRDTITLRQVTVAYSGRSHPALDHVSLTIAPGEHLTVTGPSGAGKTTLLALLLGFCSPASGTILAGGTDISALDLRSWRDQIAWVPQHPHLFAVTVAENIALGQPAASRADIARAAALGGAAEFIEALPQGYDTPLGERGLRLSAGQRQKIAIARAFLRDAPLLLLDEPTAHLDPLSAAEVGDVLTGLMAGRTVLQVTHAMALAAETGRRLRLDHGRLQPEAPCSPVGGQPALAVAR